MRAPNHDVAVVTMVRAELSSHRVGIHKVSRMARAGCLFEGVMVTNVGCSSQPGQPSSKGGWPQLKRANDRGLAIYGPVAEVAPSGLQGKATPHSAGMV